MICNREHLSFDWWPAEIEHSIYRPYWSIFVNSTNLLLLQKEKLTWFSFRGRVIHPKFGLSKMFQDQSDLSGISFTVGGIHMVVEILQITLELRRPVTCCHGYSVILSDNVK